MEKENSKYLQKRVETILFSSILCLLLFGQVLVICCILGLAVPLRPETSTVEKRELTKFPEFTVQGVMDGSYFSDISLWYSDSFPLRDMWMNGSDAIKEMYGIKTNQVITGGKKGDDIPTVATKESETEETSELETRSFARERASVLETESESESETENETKSETLRKKEQETLAAVGGETVGGLYIEGNTAYGMYYFHREAADTYIEAINRAASELKGQAQVYTVLVPLSSSLYLSDEKRATLDPEWSSEVQAMQYYDANLDSDVRNVPVYNTLKEHKEEYLYFRTDHHWNGLGAYYTYEKWAEMKGVTPNNLEDYEREDLTGFLGSYYESCKNAELKADPDTINTFAPLTCTTMVIDEHQDGTELEWPIIYTGGAVYSCFAGGDNPYSYIDNSGVNNGKICVAVKDSYGCAFIPFIADHYDKLYWFDYRTYNGDIIQFAKDVGADDVIFINGIEPSASIDHMERLSSLLP